MACLVLYFMPDIHQPWLNNFEPLDEQMWLSSFISLALMIHHRDVFRHAQTGKGLWISTVPAHLRCVTGPPHPPTHLIPALSSYHCCLAYRCSTWLVSISTPICFTLQLQTNILMDKGRVTWLNFWHEKTVTVMERKNVHVQWREHACTNVFFDVKV